MRHIIFPLRLIGIIWVCIRSGLPDIMAHYGIKCGWICVLSRKNGKSSGEKLADLLQTLGPAFIKLGQTLSSRYDILGEKFAADLSVLQDRLPPFPATEARAIIESELGRSVESLFSEFAETPSGSASIAQVHKAVTTEGRKVAVKILRPGIEARLASDIEFLYWLAEVIESIVPASRRFRPLEVIKILQDTTNLEMDLRLEAAAASELAENIRNDAGVRIPDIDWSRTSQKILTIEWIESKPLSEYGPHPDGEKIARRLLHSFFSQVFRDGFFHADLHPGNVFLNNDGTIELVDFGIMGRLDYSTRIYLAEMISAFIRRDYHRMAEFHFIAGYVHADQNVEAFAQACRSIGEPVLGMELEKISIGKVLAQLFRITETFNMHVQPQLLLFQKSLILVEAICRRLEPRTDMWSWSEEPVRKWMESEFGIKGKIKHHSAEVMKLLRTLPQLAERADKWLQKVDQMANQRRYNDKSTAITAAILLAIGIGIGMLI